SVPAVPTSPSRSRSACRRVTRARVPASRTWGCRSACPSRSIRCEIVSWPWSRRLPEVAAVAQPGPIEREVEACIAGGAFPGAVLRVSRGTDILYHAAFGSRSLEPESTPMKADTIFDLASLTKPLATTTAIMLLVREGKIRLDDRVTRFFPNFGVHGKTHVTVRSLLAHCSGLAGWRPFHKEIVRIEKQGRVSFVSSKGAKEWVYEQVQREKPEYPTGSKSVYSDLGFILLGG